MMDDQELPDEFISLVRAMFGDRTDEALLAMREAGFDPRQLMEAAGMDSSPAALGQLAEAMRHLMAATPSDGTINWQLTHDIARQVSMEGGDLALTDSERRRAADALSVADLWLDQVCVFPAAPGRRTALSRAEWVKESMPAWRQMAGPIAESVTRELARTIEAQQQDHPGIADMAGDATKALRTMGSAIFGMQLGQAIGTLARDVYSLSDIGLPLTTQPMAALVPSGVQAFAAGLEVPVDEVQLFLAAREAAHARLFAAAPWLGPHLFGAVDQYARFIAIDSDKLAQAVSEIDVSNPQALRDAMSGGLFELEPTEPQLAALTRLETALALVEGWVDAVVAQAVQDKLPDAVALAEMMRRRRASGGPAEHTFATLVGLNLRPRRARDAAALFGQVYREGGAAARESLWGHPDLLPLSEDLDSPLDFSARRQAQVEADAQVDAALAEILGQDDGPTDGGDAAPSVG